MGPLKLYYDVRDIFRAPRLGLSGKKIWIFMTGNLAGFILYWAFCYLSLALAGIPFSTALANYGLYPCLYGTESADWYVWAVFFIGVEAWILAIYLACTAVSRVTLKQLKGNDFFSSGDAWNYVHKHWHPIVFAPIAIGLIIAFFLFFAGIFALFGKISYVGEFLFAIPYLFYFFGSVFTVYTFFVLIVSLHYTPAIVGTYEEDTMGTVFQSYSIAWSQPWRVIAYHIVLVPLAIIAIYFFGWFWSVGYELVNYVFGCEWFMGSKLSGLVSYATSIVCPDWLCQCLACCLSFFNCFVQTDAPANLSGTETVAGVILAVSMFFIGLSVISYGLSVISVGETLMFVIFKKRSDDDNLLERKDEDELEEDEDDFNFDDDDLDNEDDESDDQNESEEIEDSKGDGADEDDDDSGDDSSEE